MIVAWRVALSSGLDELVADCILHHRRGRGEIELTHRGGPVRLDRLDAQIKDLSDLPVALSLNHQTYDGPLARRQRFFASGWTTLQVRLEQLLGHAARKKNGL